MFKACKPISMTYSELYKQIQQKRSFLCVGLDTDINRIPTHLLDSEDPVFEFNRQIVEATLDYAVAYKPNLAFYEAQGEKGWQSLRRTIQYIRNAQPSVFVLADAKRGDIGNTSGLYAKAFFDDLKADAVTLAPYMGSDTVMPFLKYENKWVVLLALTSNNGANDFQFLKDRKGAYLFEQVIKKSKEWASAEQMMYVVGATKAAYLKRVRAIVPDHFLLVPGIGAQGGNLEEVALYGMNTHCGLLVNSSRGIIYAGSGADFATKAADKAAELQQQMEFLLKKYMVI